VSDAQMACAEYAENVADEAFAVGALPARIGILEMLADVAQPGSAEERVAQRVENDIAIRVGDDAAGVGNPYAAEHDEITRSKGVYVGTLSNSHHDCSWRSTLVLSRAFNRAAATTRSSALVILMFAAEPWTSTGRSPTHSNACASSVGTRLVASARSNASQSIPYRNICGVRARHRRA